MNAEIATPVVRAEGRFLFAALISLTVGAFAIGMAEFVIMGLLPNVAATFGISVSKAGLLITGYALGVAIGGPAMAALTYRMPRKKMLCALMVIFALGNFLASVAPNYEILMAARIVSSLAHGTFLGVGSLIAASLVAPEKRASAIASIMAGLTVSNIIGVPFGTFIGQRYGWEATFAIIGVIGLAAFVGILLLVPNVKSLRSASGIRGEFAVFLKPQLLITIGVIIFGFGGMFTVFTYISPLLVGVSGFREQDLTLILVLFGVAVTLGNIIGGKLADWKLVPTLLVNMGLLTVILVVLNFTAHLKVPAVATLFVWGLLSFAIIPALQVRVLDAAKEAQTLASTTIHSAFNIANAAGAALGGLTYDGMGVQHLPWVAAIVTFLGLLLAFVSIAMERRGVSTRALSRSASRERASASGDTAEAGAH